MYDEKVPQEVKDALRVLGTAAEVGVTVAGVGALAKVGKTGKTLSALDKIDDVADAAKAAKVADGAADTAKLAKAAEVAKVVKVAEKAEDIVEDTAKAAKAAQAAEAASSTAQAAKTAAGAAKVTEATVQLADGSKIVVNSVDDLLNVMTKMNPVKGASQGKVVGNIDEIVSGITKDVAEVVQKGKATQYILKDGRIITKYPAKSGSASIQVNQGGKITKIRVIE